MQRTKQTKRSFVSDERAIEGLPIRLVIAIVVGIAALAIMMNILSGIGDFGETEVTIELEEGQTLDLSGDENVTLTVVDEHGDRVEGATLLFEPSTARGDLYRVEMLDNQSTVTIEDFTSEVNAHLASDQRTGDYEIDILPPTDSSYVDEESNPKIVILDN